MRKIVLALVVLSSIALGAYLLSTRVKMTVEYPEAPKESAAAEAPAEEPPFIQTLRASLPSAEGDPAVKASLQQGADPNTLDLKGRPALYWAVSNGDEASARALLEAGANVNLADREMQWTPLMHAAYQAARDAKRMPLVKLLLEKKADVNAANPQGFTALHVAVVNGGETGAGPELVDFLLRNGADPNSASATDGNPGTTPLMEAAREGKIALAKLLVKAGAKLDTKGPGGMTAADIALENKHPELAQALRVAGVVEKPKK